MDRKTNYLWNNFSSPTFDVNIGVSQGSVLSPILLALYLSLFLYILEKHLKIFNILVSIISFIDDGLFISQSKLFYISNSCLFCSYNVIMSYASSPIRKTTFLRWCHLRTLQVRLPQQPPFSQHVLWRCCNLLDIPSSTAEILLFNSVFHDRVAPVSVSTLKPLLGAIGVLPLKPRASPIVSVSI